MRLSTYDNGRGQRPALQRHAGDGLIDIAALVELGGDALLASRCADVQMIVAGGPDLATQLRGLADKHHESLAEQSAVLDPATVTFLPPVTHPEKIICIGLNYHDHVAETGQAVPTEPMFFAKFANSLIGHGQAITPPAGHPSGRLRGRTGRGDRPHRIRHPRR